MMGIRYKESDVDSYLQQYPELSKWVVRCSGCQKQGLRLNTPTTLVYLNLFRYLTPMTLSERMLCEVCEAAMANSN
jgi:hypothetical protein